MGYSDFRVIIEDKEHIRILKSSGISVRGNIQNNSLEKKTMKIICRWLNEGNIKKREELEVLGSYLYNLLFEEKIRHEFKDEFDKTRKLPDTVFRLILEFEPPARELAKFPWEYIYYPDIDGGFFIATRGKLILARHVPIQLEIPEATCEPLRILIVISQPEGAGLKPVKAESTIETIRELGENDIGKINISVLEQPTILDFQNALKNNPHILHFIGHGKSTDGTAIAFMNDDKKTFRWVNESDFAYFFVDFQPRLIFLHACEGAHKESYGAFRDVALKMVYSKVPAVVAMQYEVKNDEAIVFTKQFYQSLGEGKAIDEAVQDGRGKLAISLDDGENFSSRAFGSPVVYVQIGDRGIGEHIVIAEKEDKTTPLTKQPRFKCSNPRCQGMNEPDAKFCNQCGLPTSAGMQMIQKSISTSGQQEATGKQSLGQSTSSSASFDDKKTGGDRIYLKTTPISGQQEATGKQSLGQSTSSSVSFDDKKTGRDRIYLKPGEKR